MASMGPTQLSTQDHGKRVASVFEMEEEGLPLFPGSENPPETAGMQKFSLNPSKIKAIHSFSTSRIDTSQNFRTSSTVLEAPRVDV